MTRLREHTNADDKGYQFSPEEENKVFSEILWGVNVRLQRKEERNEQTFKQQLIRKYEKRIQKQNKREHRSRKQREPPRVNHNQSSVFHQDSSCFKVIDRRTLTRAEHTKLLATPKQSPDCVHKECLPKKIQMKSKNAPEMIPPRLHLLSLPKAQQLLHTWKRFKHYMPTEKIAYIRELLKKTDSLTTQHAQKYFNDLKKQNKKSSKRKQSKLQKTQQIEHTKCGLKKDVDKFINKLMKHFYKIPLGDVKYRHTIITNEIIDRLTNKSLRGTISRCSKHPYCVTLYDFVDQVSLWVDQKIYEMDTIEVPDDKSLTITYSGTDTTATASGLLYSILGNEINDILKSVQSTQSRTTELQGSELERSEPQRSETQRSEITKKLLESLEENENY